MYTTVIRDLDIKVYTSSGRIKCKQQVQAAIDPEGLQGAPYRTGIWSVSPQIRKVLSFLYQRCRKGGWDRNNNFNFIKEIHNYPEIPEHHFTEYLAINALDAERYDIFKTLDTTEMNHVNLWSACLSGGDSKCFKLILTLLQRETVMYPEIKESLMLKAASLLQTAIAHNDTLTIKRILKDTGIEFSELPHTSMFISNTTTVNTFKQFEKYAKMELTDMISAVYTVRNQELLSFLLNRLTCDQVVKFISEQSIQWYYGWKLALARIKSTATQEQYLLLYENLEYITSNMFLPSGTVKNLKSNIMIDILLIHNLFLQITGRNFNYSSNMLNRLCLIIKRTNLLHFATEQSSELVKEPSSQTRIVQNPIYNVCWTNALAFRKLFAFLSKPENLNKINSEYHAMIDMFNKNHLATWERICNTLSCSSGTTYGVMPIVLEMINEI